MPDGRFAPSPTGALHLGNLRTALVAWLFARHAGSRFALRIDDLDPVAGDPRHAAGQLADLAALGLDWDGPVVRTSERRARHDEVIATLEADGRTYPCFCTRREIRAEIERAARAPNGDEGSADGAYPGTCRHLGTAAAERRAAEGRPAALRLRTDGERVVVHDRLAGRVEGVVDDLVLRRNDGTPAYNLVVVVDDADLGVGEVVRGDDLLSSTPRQVHLARLLGPVLSRPEPAYAHVPLVLGPSGRRLAKRDGAVTLADRVAAGESPAVVLGHLAASLGLAEPGEPARPADLLARFDPAALPRDPWIVPASMLGGA